MSNERLPVDKKDSHSPSLIKKIGAGVALSIALIAPAGCSSDKSPDNPTTSSVDQAPDETEAVDKVVDISKIDGRPTKEQIALAKEGIPGDLSPKEAVRYAAHIITIIETSGRFEIIDGEMIQTEESMAEGDELVRALFGDSVTDRDIERGREARSNISKIIYSNEIMHGSFIRITSHENISDPVDLGNGLYTVRYDDISTIKSDKEISKNLVNLDRDIGCEVDIAKTNGKWHFTGPARYAETS